jgi:protein-S-isoprenylcysteine O-methyltransferase Ste14
VTLWFFEETAMTATNPPARPDVLSTSGRWVHRRTCILAGGLAAVGGTLALLVHPWFAAVAAVGGIWLIFAPESSSCG